MPLQKNSRRTSPANPTLLNNLAWLLGESGNEPRAIEIGQRAYELAPQSPDIIDTLGWLHVGRGTIDRGVALLKEAHDLAPDRTDIAFHYAKAMADAGEKEAARGVLQKALEDGQAFPDRPKGRGIAA